MIHRVYLSCVVFYSMVSTNIRVEEHVGRPGARHAYLTLALVAAARRFQDEFLVPRTIDAS